MCPLCLLQTTVHGKGPHISAAAEAVRVAAAAKKPPARVLFRAAAKVEAPERPEAALCAQQLAALSRRRVKGADLHLTTEVSKLRSAAMRAAMVELVVPVHMTE